MEQFQLSLLVIGAIVAVLGVLHDPLRRSPLSAPMLALALGVLLGPRVSGLLSGPGWPNWSGILEQACRLTLAISLMEVGLRVPADYMRRWWRSAVVALTLLMVLMWAVSSALAWLLVGGGWVLAMLIGAAITPTDPVLASTIVSGDLAERNISARLRNTVSYESGGNDGLAYLLATLPVSLMDRPTAAALRHWAAWTLLWEVGGAIVVGAATGYAAAVALEWAKRRGIVRSTSHMAYAAAVALGVLGISSLIHNDAVLAAFAAGRGMSWGLSSIDRLNEERMQEAVTQFFILPVFVLVGVLLPWSAWAERWPTLLGLGAAVLLLRRWPAVLVVKPLMPVLRLRADTMFYGWFGPIGVSAVFYCMFALRHGGHEIVWTVGSLVVTLSILVHGATASWGTRAYGRLAAAEPSRHHAGTSKR